MIHRAVAAALLLLALAPAVQAQFAVTPRDLTGNDGIPEAWDVETPWYRARFTLAEAGSATSLIYKPLNLELRAEDYYATRNNLFRDWVRQADPDPITGFTRRIGPEIRAAQFPAAFRVLRQTPQELVLQFEIAYTKAGGLEWFDKLRQRRRLTFRADSPAVRVENEILNTDAEPRSVLFDLFNGLGLGRVETAACIPGPEGKIVGRDRATEDSSTFIFAPEPAGDWIGGVNAEGQGAAFSLDWADVDSMEISLWKTVGATYIVNMRRRTIPPGEAATFVYTFMPFAGLGALDGMRDDLAGGLLVGAEATHLRDTPSRNLQPGATVPVKLFLVSGSPRAVKLRVRCVRQEDGQPVLDEARNVALATAAAQTTALELTPPAPGLYVLTATAEADGTTLRMEKGIEVGRTKLTYAATPPPGEKRGARDAGESLGPAPMNPQFTTIDRAFRTPHLPLARNGIAGAARAFFVAPADSTLGHIREIAQRADVEYDYAAIGKIQTPPDELNFQDVAAFRKKLRASDAEVLVTLGINWRAGLPRPAVQEILERVRDGMGLVVAARNMEEQPDLAAALEGLAEVPAPLPPCAVPVPPVKRYELGKGRVAVILCRWSNYRDAGEAVLGQWTSLATPEPRPVPELRWRGFEYSYAWLGQTIHWAARRTTPAALIGASLEGRAVRLLVNNPGEPFTGTLRLTARTRRWDVCASGTIPLTPLPAGDAALFIPLDAAPPGGPFAIEAALTRHDGKLAAFASFALAQPEPVALALTPKPGPFQPARRPGSCLIEATGDAPDARLEVEVTDRYGRLLLREERPLLFQEGKAQVEVALASLKPLTAYHEVLARVTSGGVRLAESVADLFLLSDQPPFAERFVLGVPDSPERRALHLQAILKTARDLGFEAHSNCYDDRMGHYSGAIKCAMVSVSPKSRFAAQGERPSLDSKNLVMKPPFLPAPEALEQFKQRWQGLVRRHFDAGARFIQIDDERRMSGDFDFSPETLAGFRAWLKTRYKDIAELNAAWAAQFADFDAVMPKPRAALGESPNLAPWLEHRMYMGELIGEYYMKKPAEWAAEISPLLSVGEMGIYDASSAWPVDWSRYAPCYRYTQRYGNDDLLRSFGQGSRHGQWQGYGMTRISAGRRVAAWASLLNGGNFAWFWALMDNGYWNYGVCTSDQRPTEGYAVLAAEEFPDLTGGIDRVFIASTFTHDGIAIGYSYPSWVADAAALAQPAKSIIEELGFEHQYVNLEDAARGALQRDGYRLLVLRDASCLSREQAEGIARFVESGGTLLAVGRCGWRDARGAPHAAGPVLDAALGLDSSNVREVDLPHEATLRNRPVKLRIALAGVRLKGADALGEARIGDRAEPLLTVSRRGKGRAFWLNSTLKGHEATFTGGVNAERSITLTGPEAIRLSHWRIFAEVLTQAGLTARAQLLKDGDPVFNARTWYYETPSKRTLLVARHLDQELAGPLTLRFARKAHVYEARDGRYLGFTDTVQESFPRGRMKIFALLDTKPTALSLRSATPALRPGETLALTCALAAEAGIPDLHALRLRVLGPEGKELTPYRRTLLAPGGAADVEIPLALNDPAGEYLVEATDALTGLTGRLPFRIIP